MPRCKGFNNNRMRCKKLTKDEYCSSHTPSQYVCEHIVKSKTGERHCKLPANNSHLCPKHCPVHKDLYNIYAEMNFDAIHEFNWIKDSLKTNINVINLDLKNCTDIILSYINPIQERDFMTLNNIIFSLSDEFAIVSKITYPNTSVIGCWRNYWVLNTDFAYYNEHHKRLIFCPYKFMDEFPLKEKLFTIFKFYCNLLHNNENFFHDQSKEIAQNIGVNLKESKEKFVNFLLSISQFINFTQEKTQLLLQFFDQIDPYGPNYKNRWNRHIELFLQD